MNDAAPELVAATANYLGESMLPVVAEDARCLGIGAALMRLALQRADLLGHRAVILAGGAAYYSRFGFSAATTGALRMPGPYERDRLLACELVAGALRGAGGLIASASPPPSRLSGLMDRIAGAQAPIGQPGLILGTFSASQAW